MKKQKSVLKAVNSIYTELRQKVHSHELYRDAEMKSATMDEIKAIHKRLYAMLDKLYATYQEEYDTQEALDVVHDDTQK